MQLASHADASMAVSHHALDTAKSLHRETNRHRRELSVEYTSSVVNRWLGSMLSTTTDTSGSSSSRNPRTRARNVSMLWATALASETIASPF
jgi:hypothetical protein